MQFFNKPYLKQLINGGYFPEVVSMYQHQKNLSLCEARLYIKITAFVIGLKRYVLFSIMFYFDLFVNITISTLFK